MKKRIISILLAAVMTCSMGVSVSAEEKDTDPVVIWTFADQHQAYYEWVTAEYQKEHPEVEFEIELIPIESLNEKLKVVSASEGEECPDLVDVEQGTFPYYMTDEESMIFEPLDSWFEENQVLEKASKGRMDLYAANGHYYGIEHSACPVTMAYRADLFEEYGIEVPTTWEEFKEAAEKFAENGIYIMAQEDFSLGKNLLSDVSTLLRAAGQDYVNEKGELNLSDEFKNIITDFAQMQADGLIYATQTEDEIWAAVGEGQIATYFAADWAVGRLRDNAPEQSGQWKLAPLPKLTEDSAGVSVSGGTGLCMLKYTDKDKDMLWDFMAFSQLDKDNCVEKYNMAAMYPVVYDAMPECTGEVEYLGNQDQGALYEELAKELPSQYQASWRSTFVDTFASNAYDFYEGNIDADEFCSILTEAVENYGK